MARAQKTTQPAQRISAQVSRALREGALIISGVLAFILWYALFTYDTSDPGFSQATSSTSVNNGMGRVGAFAADFLFNFFGRPAYLFTVMVVYLGWMLYREQKTQHGYTRMDYALRVGGFVATLVTSCALATLHFSSRGFNETAGGIVGRIVGEWLESVMKLLGASTLLFVVWVASMSLFLGISWFNVMDRVGRWCLVAYERARAKIGEMRDKAEGRRQHAARQDIIETEKKRTAKRSKPRIEPVMPALEPSVRAERERQVPLFDPPAAGELPPLSLLDDPPPQQKGYSEESLEAMSRLVELKLKDFNVDVEVKSVSPGPVITRFELDPAPGVKVSQIANLAKDIARSLSVVSVRVVEVIPGKSFVGLEIPNESRELVTLGEILKSRAYDDLTSPLTLALGKDIGGNSVVADLARMPHLLIAGTTGSGKSVAINAMVLSMLYKTQPEHVRLIMIDPKMLELSVYEGIPHLLDAGRHRHERSGQRIALGGRRDGPPISIDGIGLGVRNIGGYNRKVREAMDARASRSRIPTFTPPPLEDEEKPVEHPTLTPLPYIVVIIDELADMMMIVGKKVEELIARLAQKAQRIGYPYAAGDAATVGRCDHRPDQSERAEPDRVPGIGQSRLAARFSIRWARRTCSGTATCSICRPARHCRSGCTARSSPIMRCIRLSGTSRRAGRPGTLDEILEGPASPGRRVLTGIDQRAVGRTARMPSRIRFTTRLCRSSWIPARRQYRACSGA